MPSDKNVWIVDDNVAIASTLVFLLTVQKIPVVSRTNAQEVLADLANGIVPLAMVLDMKMPYNGITLLSAIASNKDFEFPIIVQTGLDDAVPKDLAWRVTALVRKPSDPAEFLDLLRNILATAPAE